MLQTDTDYQDCVTYTDQDIKISILYCKDRESINNKTLIFLHGAGGNGQKYIEEVKKGIFPQPDFLKLMFLTSNVVQKNQNPWMKVNRNLPNDDPNRHDLEDIEKQCIGICNILNKEINQTYNGDASKVFLGGKSQGACLSLYIQLIKLDKPLGGICCFSGYPILPLRELLKPEISSEQARLKAKCVESNLRIFIWHGDIDERFPLEETFPKYKSLFEKLKINDAVKIMEIEQNLGHQMSKNGMNAMIKFIEQNDKI